VNGWLKVKLKKLLAIEVTSAMIGLVVVLGVIGVLPFLASSSDTHIGVFNERVFSTGILTLSSGETSNAQFNYSSYDPPIVVIELDFKECQESGKLSLYANNRMIATLNITPESSHVILDTVSFSGSDWVEPRTVDSFTFGNQVTFSSPPQSGYAGTLSYQISIRGSR
jgi:hypothetical protein